jgi:hypothetical protein
MFEFVLSCLNYEALAHTLFGLHARY